MRQEKQSESYLHLLPNGSTDTFLWIHKRNSKTHNSFWDQPLRAKLSCSGIELFIREIPYFPLKQRRGNRKNSTINSRRATVTADPAQHFMRSGGSRGEPPQVFPGSLPPSISNSHNSQPAKSRPGSSTSTALFTVQPQENHQPGNSPSLTPTAHSGKL